MRPAPKGWCPTAERPMVSGDGMILRLRPRLGRMTYIELLKVLDLSENFGNGMIEVTNRANLQLRGVSQNGHQDILSALYSAKLVDPSQEAQSGRNLILAPGWTIGDLSEKLGHEFFEQMTNLPALPSKFGFSIDIEENASLKDTSSDIRLERLDKERLLVRADGARAGRVVTVQKAVTAMCELAQWFVDTKGHAAGRMASHLKTAKIPKDWTEYVQLNKSNTPLSTGRHALGAIVGLPFGQCSSNDLRKLIIGSKAQAIRITPWRSLLLEGVETINTRGFIYAPQRDVRNVSACSGAPACIAASVETRELAQKLSSKTTKSLHVSGCTKGCARPKASDITVTGRDGNYDLILNGAPWENPIKTALTQAQLTKEIERL